MRRRLVIALMAVVLPVAAPAWLGPTRATAQGDRIAGDDHRDAHGQGRGDDHRRHHPFAHGEECFVATILDVPAFVPGQRFCLPVGVVPTVVSPGGVFVDQSAPYPPAAPVGGSPQIAARGIVSGTVPPPPSVADLARAPARYDRQGVSVRGTIGDYTQRFTDRDVPYTEFRLEAGGASIPVVAWGHAGLQRGLRVRVTGTFHDGAPFVLSGGERLQTVLEAMDITPTSGGVPGP